MTPEETQKMLETISKSGINVKGDLVLEKHVEHEVNNVEPGGIGIQINNGEVRDGNAPKNKDDDSKKGTGGRPKRIGKKIYKSFIYKVGDKTNERLQLFFHGLKALGWIKAETDMKIFLSLFSGEETNNRVVWTGDINVLTELFKELITRKQYVKLPEGESIWVMVNARFWDNKGNNEFGNERLGSTRQPIKSMDNINTLVEILDPKSDIDELREKMQGQ